MMPILYATPGLIIEHDAPLHWLCLTWRGIHSSLAAQHCCAEVLAQVRATGSTKILNDATEDCDGWEEGVPWLTKEFFHQLAGTGITTIAWVVPHNIRAYTALNNAMSVTAWPVVTTFTDVEAAYTWLCKVKTVSEEPSSLKSSAW